MPRTESQVLADTMDKTRQLIRYYISGLKTADPYQSNEFGGIQFNSLYWLTAHLIWAEDNLIVRGSTGDSVAPEWIQHYHLGSDGSLHEGHGDFKELLDLMKDVHEKSLAHLRLLTDEKLDAENKLGFGFGDGDKSVRMLIMHAIRHEGTHIGNFAFLCKMKGIKMV
ncbi:MAG: DinB superfamily protein [Bacteroidetes bacterium]|nr:DinB superfamily protein [Bacteroidota bacterium]